MGTFYNFKPSQVITLSEDTRNVHDVWSQKYKTPAGFEAPGVLFSRVIPLRGLVELKSIHWIAFWNDRMSKRAYFFNAALSFNEVVLGSLALFELKLQEYRI